MRRPPWGMLVATIAAALWWARAAQAAISSPEAAFDRANEAYKHGRYQEAVNGYLSVRTQGVESGALYYNLGNACLKSDRKGEALWAYLMAARFLPGDADLHANLTYARSLLPAAEAVSVKPSRLARWLSLGGRYAASALAAAGAVLLWAASLAWAIVGWLPKARRGARPVAWLVSLAAAVAATALLIQTFWIERVPTAVAIRDGAQVRYAPQASGTPYFALPEGAIVRLLQQEHGWAQVQRADGRAGWAEASSMKPLE